MTSHTDILIVGGGPIGAAFALALKDSRRKVTLLEAREPGGAQQDGRTLALSHGSKVILERLGVWTEALQSTPITSIHVSHRGGFGRALLSAQEAGLPALGYVVSHAALAGALHQALSASNMDYLTGAMATRVETTRSYASVEFSHRGEPRQQTAQILVLADGGRDLAPPRGVTIHERDYAHTALTCQVRTDQPHANRAYERFTPTGPAALLPNGAGYALVWTADPAQIESIATLDDDEFLQRLQQHFGERAGRFVSAGKRVWFSLKLRYAVPVAAGRIVLIGNAAQALHPIAGQGFNLGLRDAWTLGRLIVGEAEDPPFLDEALIAHYQRVRRVDRRVGISFTDFLVRSFSNDNPLLKFGRGLGLAAFDMLPPARKFLASRMIFGAKP